MAARAECRLRLSVPERGSGWTAVEVADTIRSIAQRMRIAKLFLAVALAAQAQTVSLEQRQQDLQCVLTQLPQLHPNFFSVTPRATFDTAGRELQASALSISAEEFYTRLAGLVAMGRGRSYHVGLNFERCVASRVYDAARVVSRVR